MLASALRSYPFDAELNLNGFRADWKLSDGTFVEALGFPNDLAYMAKAQLKMKLPARQGIPLIAVTQSDTGDLASIFSTWLPKGATVARASRVEAPD